MLDCSNFFSEINPAHFTFTFISKFHHFKNIPNTRLSSGNVFVNLHMFSVVAMIHTNNILDCTMVLLTAHAYFVDYFFVGHKWSEQIVCQSFSSKDVFALILFSSLLLIRSLSGKWFTRKHHLLYPFDIASSLRTLNSFRCFFFSSSYFSFENPVTISILKWTNKIHIFNGLWADCCMPFAQSVHHLKWNAYILKTKIDFYLATEFS